MVPQPPSTCRIKKKWESFFDYFWMRIHYLLIREAFAKFKIVWWPCKARKRSGTSPESWSFLSQDQVNLWRSKSSKFLIFLCFAFSVWLIFVDFADSHCKSSSRALFPDFSVFYYDSRCHQNDVFRSQNRSLLLFILTIFKNFWPIQLIFIEPCYNV